MRQLFTVLAFIIFSCNSFAQKNILSDNSRNFNDLDSVFERALKTFHVAGFAIAVVDKDHILYSKGFGYRDLENKLPVTTNTLFPIASCTKAFTAAMIGILDDQKKLDIDKPVINYLPELRFYNDAMNNIISLRDMMTHRTGLPGHDASWYFFNPSRDSLIHRISHLEPTAGVRERSQYNNLMYAIQGSVIEKTTGNTWAQNIKDNFLAPLGMESTLFSINDLNKTANHSIGYVEKDDSIISKITYSRATTIDPAGALISSVNDMEKWVRCWLNEGKYNGKQIIPHSFYSQAISSQAVLSPNLPNSKKKDWFLANNGLGWLISSYKGHYLVEHGGNINGFRSCVAFLPTDSIGMIILCNQYEWSLPFALKNIIADRLLHLNPTDWIEYFRERDKKLKKEDLEERKSLQANKKNNTAPSHPLKDFEGVYSNAGYGELVIKVKNDSLFASNNYKNMWLRHFHYDVFELFENDQTGGFDTSEPVNFQVQFHMNPAGDINSLTIPFEPDLKPIAFIRRKVKE